MNGILGKAKYGTLKILLNYGASYLIVLGKHTQKLRHKKTQPVKWSTQGGEFLTAHKTNVELVSPELDAKKSMECIFLMDSSQNSSRYDMIIGRDLLLELKLDLCFSNSTIRGGKGAYEGFTTPLKYPYDFFDNTSLRNK